MTLDLDTLQLGSPAFDRMQGLRDLQDIALSLSAHCKGSLEIIEKFQEISGAGLQGVWSLNSYKALLVGYVENMSVLTKRIGNTIDLVSLIECETGYSSQLMAFNVALVCICPRFEESVHRCRHQQSCIEFG